MWRGRDGIAYEACHLSMATIHPECSNSDPANRSLADVEVTFVRLYTSLIRLGCL
jgi:hypothetical protein